MSNLTFRYSVRRFSERHSLTGATLDVVDPDLIVKILSVERAGYEIEVISLMGEGLSLVTIFNSEHRETMLLDGSDPDLDTNEAIEQLISKVVRVMDAERGAIGSDDTSGSTGEAA